MNHLTCSSWTCCPGRRFPGPEVGYPVMKSAATVSDELSGAVTCLRDAGVESPQLDAQLMMAHALGCSRLQIVAHPDRVPTTAQSSQFRSMLDKRAARYPLAYILGTQEFYGLEIDVTPHVLIPRPETEILVEELLKRVGEAPYIADVGTGSGAIAVALAVNLPGARIWATDSSEQALKVVRANAEKHGVVDRVSTMRGNLLEPTLVWRLTAGRASPRLDAIVSNPPYIPTGDIDSLQPEVRCEPREALDGGPDGLDAYRKLLPQARILTPLVAVEIGAGQAEPVTQTARDAGWHRIETVRDLAGIERIVLCWAEGCQ
jgi:release factor glutamine methyltransferase